MTATEEKAVIEKEAMMAEVAGKAAMDDQTPEMMTVALEVDQFVGEAKKPGQPIEEPELALKRGLEQEPDASEMHESEQRFYTPAPEQKAARHGDEMCETKEEPDSPVSDEMAGGHNMADPVERFEMSWMAETADKAEALAR